MQDWCIEGYIIFKSYIY